MISADDMRRVLNDLRETPKETKWVLNENVIPDIMKTHDVDFETAVQMLEEKIGPIYWEEK